MARYRLIPAAIIAAVASMAMAADNGGFIGRWHWNKALSTAAPGEPLPKDVVLTITSATPAKVEWSLTRVDGDGSQHVESFSGTGKGQPAAITGGDGSMAAFTVTEHAMGSSYTNPDGSSERALCSLSADGKTMTCHGTESDGKGHSLDYTDVYERM